MLLHTPRLTLRKFELTDCDDLYEILGDAHVMRNLEAPFSKEKTRNFLSEFCIDKGGALACVLKGEGKVIGYILFKEYESDIYEIGWIFNKTYWGHGFAYESCNALVRYAFTDLDVHKIFAETTDREKSVPLMEKLGMIKEGVQRKHALDSTGKRVDLYLYGLLASDLSEVEVPEV